MKFFGEATAGRISSLFYHPDGDTGYGSPDIQLSNRLDIRPYVLKNANVQFITKKKQ